ncbi:hypothetical protein, partial [Acetobacter pomorum]|uniref:hypothetical protein n=1 Tax=Acetobacter pomorum TaxID=65959 RepID=UPI001ABF7241
CHPVFITKNFQAVCNLPAFFTIVKKQCSAIQLSIKVSKLKYFSRKIVQKFMATKFVEVVLKIMEHFLFYFSKLDNLPGIGCLGSRWS